MRRLEVIRQHLNRTTFEDKGPLAGKTLVITGASRGIGYAIALRAAADGANIAILAKTDEPHPKLEGTIHTAAEAVRKAGGKALALKCDVRHEDSVTAAIAKVVETFGGIDILVNNASAISLTDTLSTNMKQYDLMHSINARGTFLLSKTCIPHLLKSRNPHILNLAPPVNMKPCWFSQSLAYTMAKYFMSLCAYGMSAEYEGQIGVNCLWPRTTIATAAVRYAIGGDSMMKVSRTPAIMADAAYKILTSDCTKLTGNFLLDEDVVGKIGLEKYNVDPSVPQSQLCPDGFID